jgi:UDP-glucose 4-epimerase
MRVLVTGGSGFIGAVTTRMLLNRGYFVTIFDNLERGHREAIDDRADLIEGDLRERADIISAMRQVRPQAVVHFAAYALVGESMADPMMYYRNNVVGSVNLLDAMLQVDCKRIVFSSTCATYGDPVQLPIEESMFQNPTNPYGHSKLIIEQILNWHHTLKGLKPTFLRYFNACGADDDLGEDHDPETHLIPNVLNVALGQKPYVEVFGNNYPTVDGTCVRDYIHVRDLAKAHMLALENGKEGAYNLGTGVGVSVKEVVEICRQVSGQSIPVRYSPRRAGDPPVLVASGEKARMELGWIPECSAIERIIQDAWKWHSSRKANGCPPSTHTQDRNRLLSSHLDIYPPFCQP